MRQFIVKSDDIKKDVLVIRATEARHMLRTLRMKKGDPFFAVNGKGTKYRCEIKEISKGLVAANICDVLSEKVSSKILITLTLALTKSSTIEVILRRLTEIGVDRFILFPAARSIVKSVSAQKILRWKTILKEAVKQSKRSSLPELQVVGTFQDIVCQAERHDMALIPSLEEHQCRIKDLHDQLRMAKSLIYMIGPEGDFDFEELECARTNGWVPVTLGTNILRMDTAALYVVANIL